MDEGSVDVLLDVGSVNAAGGQELQANKGCGQVLHSVQAAIDVCGEELDHLQALGFILLALVLRFWYPLHKKQVDANVAALKAKRGE